MTVLACRGLRSGKPRENLHDAGLKPDSNGRQDTDDGARCPNLIGRVPPDSLTGHAHEQPTARDGHCR
jgi:hypothetical protein